MLTADQLKIWVSKGEIGKVLRSLQGVSNADTRNEILQLAARYNEYRRQSRLGLDNTVDLNVELAKIRQALLESIDGLSKQGVDVFPHPRDAHEGVFQKEKQNLNLKWKNAVFIILLIVAGFFLFLYWCESGQPEDKSVQVPTNSKEVLSDTGMITKPSKKVTESRSSAAVENAFEFYVTVRDSLTNERVENASVWIGGREIFSHNGQARFMLPSSEKEKMFEILVEKEGFKSKRQWRDLTEDEKEFKINRK